MFTELFKIGGRLQQYSFVPKPSRPFQTSNMASKTIIVNTTFNKVVKCWENWISWSVIEICC